MNDATQVDSRHIEMLRMRNQGFSDAEIGDKFKLSRQRVHAILGPAATDRRRIARTLNSVPVVPRSKSTAADWALPNALIAWRARHGLTQADASAILHLAAVTTYSNWERGLGCSLAGLVLDFIELWEFHKTYKNILTKQS